MKLKFNLFLTITTVFAFILTSCGSANNSIIATAVALTVQAHDTQSSPVTETPLALATSLPLAASLTPATGLPLAGTSATTSTVIPPTAAAPIGTITKFCTANATFVSETVPDGTIESPGATFTKDWTIQNSGTCAWDSTWKLVFVSGDLMGAAYVFNFPQPVAPGQNVDVPIVFTAPTTEGSYTGYWKLQSPWGLEFGDSDSGNPFWVTINVNSGTPGANTPTVYGITSVAYSISQNGCCTCGKANVFYTTTATISSSGPITIYYYWTQSDGGRGSLQSLNFTQASSQTVSDTWPIRLGTEIGIHWEQLVMTSPVKQVFNNTDARFDSECH
jgi:Ig-like domain from next to BRCA1 gene